MDGEIGTAELEARLNDDAELLVVDIRNPHQYEQEHIPESVNVPLSRLPQEIDSVSDADHVVTVCPHGQASVKAARLIASFDEFDGRVDSLECGLTGWDGPTDGRDDAGDAPDTPF